ncbi:MAG: hypothetical protein JNG89_09330 [Planctomycetaceae bacterium]|nr:hypothetical protein [Planctomycetaceae bacterium]
MLGRVWIASIGMVMLASAAAPASYIHRINPSTGNGVGGTLLSADYTDNPFDTVGPLNDPGPFANENYTGPAAANGNFADLELDVLQQDSPFNVQVLRHGAPAAAAEYAFEVTLHNQTNAVINNVGVKLLSAPNGLNPADLARFDVEGDPSPTGGIFTRISDSWAIFSGLALAPGATQVLGFSLDFLADTVGPFGDQNHPVYIQFTATPEPGSLILGGITLLAGLVVHRRRRQGSDEPRNSDQV